MKVLFIAPQPFFRVRGTPINVLNVVTSLADHGHEVDLLCYPFGDPVEIPGVQIIRSPGVPGIRDVKIGPSLAKFPLDGFLFFKALGLCRRGSYDVIHAVEESAFFAVLLKRWFKTRLIYDMDSMISDQLRYSRFISWGWVLRLVERMEAWAARESDIVLTVCQSLTDGILALAPDARVVQIEDAPLQEAHIPDEASAGRIRNAHGLQGARVIVYTGNLERYQGIELLVQAADAVMKAIPEAHFLIVGGTDEHLTNLKQLTVAQGVADHFTFTGAQPMEDMPSYLTLADVLVSPRIEGTNTALKIYTYMQAAKPIVATRLTTHTQVLDDQTAMLVESEPAAFAQGLIDVLLNPECGKALGKACAERVEQEYSLNIFRKKVQETYGLIR